MREKTTKAGALLLSVLLPIWNIVRLIFNAPGARQVAVAVTSLRGMYEKSPVDPLDFEEIIKTFADGADAHVVIPAYVGDPDKVARGSTPVSKLMTVTSLLQYHQARSALEIGTYMGVASLWIAANISGNCHTLDLPVGEAGEGREADRRLVEAELRETRVFKGHPLEERIIEHFGDSRRFDYSDISDTIDFVYVDGGHALEFIASDTVNALSLISSEGFIVWDDFLPFHMGSHPGVREFIVWFDSEIDKLYDIGGQAAWFGRLSSEDPASLAERCRSGIAKRWPGLIS